MPLRRLVLVLFAAAHFSACGDAPSAPPKATETKTSPLVQLPAFRAHVLEGFRHARGAEGAWNLREIMSGGGALADLNDDGRLDIVCVQSDPRSGRSCILWHSQGLEFERQDLPDFGRESYGMSCAVGDADGDGDLDLYFGCVGRDRFLRNEGQGHFVDATESSGFGDTGYSSSAVWFDADRDGDLDLYVSRYIDTRSPSDACRNLETGRSDYCNPTSYRKTRDLFYRNEKGHFSEVGTPNGLGARKGYGLAAISSDFDDDGDLDVYVANDQSPAFLWRNEGSGVFQEVGVETGCGLDGEGAAIAGMGIVSEDFDGDGDFDLFVTNIRERDHLFLRRQEGEWLDVSARWGTINWLRPRTGFGVAAFDQDHDGSLDLYIANGAVMARPFLRSDRGQTGGYREEDDFLRYRQGRFRPAAPRWRRGPSPFLSDLSRGLCRGDLDQDGDIDLIVFRNNDSPLLLENLQQSDAHWLVVDVREPGGAPALNARVEVKTSRGARVAESRAQESYLSSRDPRLHFGLGAETEITELKVTWAQGATRSIQSPRVDQILRIEPDEGRTGR